MCLAVQIAQTCQGYREWKDSASDGLRRDFTFPQAEATKIFDAYLLDTAQAIYTQPNIQPDHERRCHDFTTDSPEGDIYFEFVLRDCFRT